MHTTESLRPLTVFRQAIYRYVLGHRKDTLFELLDAVLTNEQPTSLVRLTLAPVFRRRWASAPDALTDGTLDSARLRALLVLTLPDPPPDTRPLWALDGTTWPRPEAKTSPARTYGRRVTAGLPQEGVVPAWEYQWLVAVPDAAGSWVLPLDVRRRGPTSATPTALALDQLRTTLALRPPAAPRPLVTLDSQYEVAACRRAALPADLLIRLASHRVLYRAPPPYAGRGRPRRHGAVFRFKDPATHGPPTHRTTTEDPDYGSVQVDGWTNLHTKQAPDASFALVRVQVARLPRRATAPAPLWLAWVGGPLPDDLLLLWHAYRRRFAIEHGFRFGKADLGWTTIRPRSPATADRWTWLVLLVYWHLWLARPLVADQRLPWERPRLPTTLTPGRVRRACAALLPRLGTPARPPRPRGKSPGRPPGACPGPRPRAPVVRRHPKTHRRQRKRAA